MTKGSNPKFLGGFDSPVSIPYPKWSSTKNIFDDQAAFAQGTPAYFTGTDVWLTFYGDGKISYRTGSGSDNNSYSNPVKMNLTDFAPNGIIYIGSGNVYMSGTLKGQVSVYADGSSGLSQGNILLTDNMIYTQEPMTYDNTAGKWVPNENCTDMLGLVSSNNIIAATQPAAAYAANITNKDINIYATMFTARGALQLEGLNNKTPLAGTMLVKGGEVTDHEENIANYNNKGVVTGGYNKYIIFDERFLMYVPPHFPGVFNRFESVSWLE